MQDNFETSSLERQAADPANKRFQTQERGALKKFLMMYVLRIDRFQSNLLISINVSSGK